MNQAGDIAERLYDTGLVVGQLDRDQSHAAVQQQAQGIEVDEAVPVDGRDTHLLAAGERRLHHGWMLHRADHHRSGSRGQRAQHSKVVGLGPTGSERDAARVHADRSGDRVARFIDRGSGGPGHLVATGGVAVPLCQPGKHGRGCRGAQRTIRGVVKIGQHRTRLGPVPTRPPGPPDRRAHGRGHRCRPTRTEGKAARR